MKKPVQFGKYLLLDRINAGGMAEVFLAKQAGDPGAPHLAIKRILPTMVEDAEFLTMFLDEARISVQLNHANIVQLYELGHHEDSIYIAMEYVSGKDVRQLLDRHRADGHAMPIPQAVFIAAQVCEGLEYAHRKKDAKGADLHIVHRDITPQNILLSYRGEVKVIDFGIAKAANRIQKTQAGILKGKFGYMSPEQVLGKEVDHRSDLFAVGVTLFEMLTGERLFAADSDFSTLERVRNAQVPPPRTLNAAVPEELERILYKALAREPSDRYASCGELGKELSEFLRRSGFSYSPAQLGLFLREVFAEDCAREEARLGKLTGVELEGEDELERPTRPEPMSAPRPTAQPRPAASSAGRANAAPEGSSPPVLQRVGAAAAQDDLLSAHTLILSSASLSVPTGMPTLVDQTIASLIEDELRDAATVIGLALPLAKAKDAAAKPRKSPNAQRPSASAAKAPGPKGKATGPAQAPRLSRHGLAGLRPKAPLIAAAAIALAAVALAAFWALRPRAGQLTVRANPPEAALLIDGAPAESGAALSLAPGRHRVEVQASGRKPYRAELDVVAGSRLAVDAALEPEAPEAAPAAPTPPPAPARPSRFNLKVESQPSGAAIEIDGKRVGETPATLHDVAPAEVRQVSLSLKGYRAAKLSVDWDGEMREVALFAPLERLERSSREQRQAERAATKAKARPETTESAPEKPKEVSKARALGKLITISEPVARVSIDGKDTGRWTPITPSQPLEVPAGEHVVTYTDGEGRKAVRSVGVTVGETVKVTGVKDFK